MPGSYEYVEHTADLALRAWGATIEEALDAAARALVDYEVKPGSVRTKSRRPIRVRGADWEDLSVRFLEEIRFESEMGFLAARAVLRIHGLELEGTLEGEPFDERRHGHFHEVKAVTRHGASVSHSPPEVFVVLDI